jgi:hypothetical protein
MSNVNRCRIVDRSGLVSLNISLIFLTYLLETAASNCISNSGNSFSTVKIQVVSASVMSSLSLSRSVSHGHHVPTLRQHVYNGEIARLRCFDQRESMWQTIIHHRDR